MTFETRRIFKSVATSQNVIRELLQMMFLGELLAPGGERAWLVSPWISNIVLFDNRAGGFNTINPEWGQREVRLLEVLMDMMARGTAVGVASELQIVRRPRLHTKGLLLKRGLLAGSMNFTYYGLELNDEMVAYDTTPKSLAEARINFESYSVGTK